ncbi:hypothetical protein OG533_19730 [Streptomyces sp. NBC_01186]|uniref:hypothetical protein n=1 Tax=Streptomyces sp. NBC_01186 TaxID=2903765 RepID=UPI002E0ED3BB|nr:hypothetical protein OG533_19730 [Streptomyces sp. NBC_01186]
MSQTKILTVTLEFEMGDRKIYSPRIKAAYESAVSAAIEAAKDQLLDGSVNTVRSRMSWDYRFATAATEYTDLEVEWPEEDDQSDEGPDL